MPEHRRILLESIENYKSREFPDTNYCHDHCGHDSIRCLRVAAPFSPALADAAVLAHPR